MNLKAKTPDDSSLGFLETAPDPLRYENPSRDPEEVAMKIASHVLRGSRVLDVGCGTGCISELIAGQCDAELTGIEPDADRVAMARSRGLDIVEGYLTEEFFGLHGKFDAILFVDVLEHLSSPGVLLRMARAGLNPGGRVVVSVPNIAHWSVRSRLLRGKFDFGRFGIMDATHLRWFTRRTLGELFERMGYEVVIRDSTLGMALGCYHSDRPFRWMRPNMKRRVARSMLKRWPGAFACQHIFVAKARA
jgi:methionine biosynthesis protein MetW